MTNHQSSVLVVEDEGSFVEALVVSLEREGFKVRVARDGIQAIELFDAFQPDLVLLDLMLPRLPGLDVCRSIRSRSAVPIIILTAKGTELDTVVGLEVGADDYVVKPFRMRELVARMRAVLRRGAAGKGGSPVARPDVVTVGPVSLNTSKHEVTVAGFETKLPLKEFELLELLLINAGRVLTRDTLIDRVWGPDYVGDTKTLDVHIKRLRSRIDTDPSASSLITTIRGLGYRFETEVRPRS